MKIKTSFLSHLLPTTRWILYVLFFLLPLFFLPFTIDQRELNKQTLLLVLVFVAALTWTGSMFASKHYMIRRSWMNFLPIALVISWGVSAWQSSAPFLSWVGGATQEYTSFLTIVGFALLFYLIVNTLDSKQEQEKFSQIMLWSSLCVAVLSVGNLWRNETSLSTIGTINAAGIFLIVMSVFTLSQWMSRQSEKIQLKKKTFRFLETIAIVALCVLTFIYLLMVDYWLLWLLFELGLAVLLFFAFLRAQYFSSTARFYLPMVLFILSLPFWIWVRSPFSLSVPAEVTLNSQASNEIIKHAFARISPLFGSGPGTYAFLYGRDHSAAINQTEFFATRFDRASSLFGTLLPTIGIIGFSLLILFLLVIAFRSLWSLKNEKSAEKWMQTLSLFVPWLVLVVAAAFYSFNFTLMACLFIFSSFLASTFFHARPILQVKQSKILRLLVSGFLPLGVLIFLIGIFFSSQRFIGEVAFAKAVRSDRNGASLSEIVKWLDTSATLNQYDDRAYRVLAQALLLRVSEQSKADTSLVELSDESRAYLQGLVAAAVNSAVRATDLSPENTLNWFTRGSVYRELVQVIPNASTFAISAFEKTIELEPLSPVNWTELGVTYLAAAERERPMSAATDEIVAEQAKVLVEEYMLKGEEAINKAIELKPNYAPAHYQLGLAYERQGRLDDAIGKMESVAQFNKEDVGVAFQLGQLYLRRAGAGDLGRAKNAYEYAISLVPTYSNARWYLASIFEQTGDRQSAIEQIEKVLELNPGNELVKTRLDRLIKGETTTDLPVPLP